MTQGDALSLGTARCDFLQEHRPVQFGSLLGDFGQMPPGQDLPCHQLTTGPLPCGCVLHAVVSGRGRGAMTLPKRKAAFFNIRAE